MSLCWGTSACVLRGKFVPRISDRKCSRLLCEHKHTNMHTNKDFQLSSLVLFSSKNQILFHHFLADAVPNVGFVCLVYFIDTTEFVKI